MINEGKRSFFDLKEDKLITSINGIVLTRVNIQNELKKLFSNDEKILVEVLKWLNDVSNETELVLNENEIDKIMEITNTQNYYIHSLAMNLILVLLSFSSPMIDIFIKNDIINRVILKFPFEETISIISNLSVKSFKFKEILLANNILVLIQKEFKKEDLDDDMKLKLIVLFNCILDGIDKIDYHLYYMQLVVTLSLSLILLKSNINDIIETVTECFQIFIEINTDFTLYFINEDLLSLFMDIEIKNITTILSQIKLFRTIIKSSINGNQYLLSKNIFDFLITCLNMNVQVIIQSTFELLTLLIFNEEEFTLFQLIKYNFHSYAKNLFISDEYSYKTKKIIYEFLSELISSIPETFLESDEFLNCYGILIDHFEFSDEVLYQTLEAFHKIFLINRNDIKVQLIEKMYFNIEFKKWLELNLDDEERSINNLSDSLINLLDKFYENLEK